MAFLVDRLPVPAADYSGAISAIKQMGGCVILCSPDGCIDNYSGMEETLPESQKMAFCSAAIVENEAILGLEDPLRKRAVAFARRYNPPFIALVGSPITAILGTDLRGLACEIQGETGVATLAIDTNGFDTYETGIQKAYEALFRHFVKPAAPPTRKPNLVNILGYTHLDYCNDEDLQLLLSLLEGQGKTVGCIIGYGSLQDLPRLLEAEYSLVVSASGLPLARRLKQMANIPYSCELPVGGSAAFAASESGLFPNASQATTLRTLVVGDQVMAHSLRKLIEKRYGATCDIASRVRLDSEFTREGDARAKNEAALAAKVAQGYRIVVADPLCAPVVDGQQQILFGLPRPAMSSLVYQNGNIPLFGESLIYQLDWAFEIALGSR